MKCDAPERIAAGAIGTVAHDRMAERGELSADLAAPAGVKPDLEHRRVAVPFEDPIVADRFLAATPVGGGLDAETAVLGQA